MGDDVRDGEMMSAAIALARAARRHTAPWPAVGCVITGPRGEVVGTGATGPFPTGPHAEVAALASAGDTRPWARPRTARSSPATITATLRRAARRSSRRVSPGSWSHSAIPTNGSPGAASRACAPPESRSSRAWGRVKPSTTSRPYLHHRRTGRAFVVAKVALSLDGRVAAADGSSRWITGPAARADAHELRADSQADRRRGRHCALRPARTDRAWRRAAPAAGAAAGVARRSGTRRARRTAVRSRARAHARHHLRIRRRAAPSTPGRRPAPRSKPSRSGRAGAASTSTRRCCSSDVKVCCRQSWRVVAGLLGSLVAAARAAAARSPTSRPVLLGASGARGLRVRGPGVDRSRRSIRSRRSDARRRRCAHVPRTSARGPLMFTGIVEELGRVRSIVGERRWCAHRDRRHIGARRRHDRRVHRGQRVLPHSRRARRRALGGRRGRRDDRPHEPRCPRAGRSGESRTSGALGRPPRAAISCRVTSTVPVPCARARPQPDGSELFRFDAPARRVALRRAQGFDHRRRHQPHRRGGPRHPRRRCRLLGSR